MGERSIFFSAPTGPPLPQEPLAEAGGAAAPPAGSKSLARFVRAATLVGRGAAQLVVQVRDSEFQIEQGRQIAEAKQQSDRVGSSRHGHKHVLLALQHAEFLHRAQHLQFQRRQPDPLSHSLPLYHTRLPSPNRAKGLPRHPERGPS